MQEEDNEYEEDDDTPMREGSPSKEQKPQRKVFVTYENQRWWLSTWTSTLLPGGNYLKFYLKQSDRYGPTRTAR